MRADFGSARIAVLRATWNYPERPADFLAWLERAAGQTRVYHGPYLVRWNMHKSYLLDLERRGVPVVPTEMVRKGETRSLAEIARARSWSGLVVKPAIGAGSLGTLRVAPEAFERDDAHLRVLVQRGDALVQPYQASVAEYGERALVWIDGELTHAVRKSPRFIGDPERVSPAVPIAPDEAEVARAALAAASELGGALLYARVDLVRDENGAPRVMEVELIEPSLFFLKAPPALDRYVRALVRELRDGG
jgi:hypothetical protein